MDIKSGYFQSDGSAVNVILGFVPDFLILFNDLQDTGNPNLIMWSKAVADAELTGQYGWDEESSGDFTAAATGAGINAYDTSVNDYVNIMSPIPEKGKIAVQALAYTVARSEAATARSATAIGTILRPIIRNGYVYECTTAGTAAAEPTWSTTPGVIVADNSSVYWTCREEEVVRAGGKGFTFGGTDQSDGEHVHFIAFRTDKDKYLGDAADGDLYLI